MKNEESKISFTEAVIAVIAVIIAIFATNPKVRGIAKDACKKLNESDVVQEQKEKLANGMDWLEEKIEDLKNSLNGTTSEEEEEDYYEEEDEDE